MLGELGKPRVYPPISEFSEILARGGRSRSASSRCVAAKGGRGPEAEEPWREAISQAKKEWPRAPHRYSPAGELRADGKLVIAIPAFRFGAQQVDRLRAAGDLKRGSADDDLVGKTPINLPSWDYKARMCMLFDMRG